MVAIDFLWSMVMIFCCGCGGSELSDRWMIWSDSCRLLAIKKMHKDYPMWGSEEVTCVFRGVIGGKSACAFNNCQYLLACLVRSCNPISSVRLVFPLVADVLEIGRPLIYFGSMMLISSLWRVAWYLFKARMGDATTCLWWAQLSFFGEGSFLLRCRMNSAYRMNTFSFIRCLMRWTLVFW